MIAQITAIHPYAHEEQVQQVVDYFYRIAAYMGEEGVLTYNSLCDIEMVHRGNAVAVRQACQGLPDFVLMRLRQELDFMEPNGQVPYEYTISLRHGSALWARAKKVIDEANYIFYIYVLDLYLKNRVAGEAGALMQVEFPPIKDVDLGEAITALAGQNIVVQKCGNRMFNMYWSA